MRRRRRGGGYLAALKAVTLKGCIVTADALHCHPRIASQIRAQGGHYALKLKGNHGPLFACALKAFPRRTQKASSPFTRRSRTDTIVGSGAMPA